MLRPTAIQLGGGPVPGLCAGRICLGEGGTHLTQYLALLRTFKGCHQCKSSATDLLPANQA